MLTAFNNILKPAKEKNVSFYNINVNEKKRMNVYVGKDLDFENPTQETVYASC